MRLNNGCAVRLAALALLAAVVAGCGLWVPRQESKWTALLEEIRAFEHRMGFSRTDNFLDLSKEEEAITICGRASRLYLPYSYEDCHDQFDLPYGIEEALCNVIAYKAMPVFSRERYGANSREHKAVSQYADRQEALTRATKAGYEQLERLYGRYRRKEMSAEALLRERAALFRKAEKALAWRRGALNNVGLANDMTYSRHYPLLESVDDALGRDLERTVAFFKRVDEIKPSRQAVMKRNRIDDKDSVELLRVYEVEVVKVIEKALAEALIR